MSRSDPRWLQAAKDERVKDLIEYPLPEALEIGRCVWTPGSAKAISNVFAYVTTALTVT
jgi:hypothetical protein